MNRATYQATRADMVLDPQCQLRPGGLDEEHVQAMQDAIREGRELPPLEAVRTEDGMNILYDGWHRIEAYHREGVTEFAVSTQPGDLELARLLACGANVTHGLKLSRDAIKRQAMLAIERGRDKSDRELAAIVGVSHPTIAKYRREMQEQAEAEAEPTSAPDDSGNFTTPPSEPREPSDRDDDPPKKPAKPAEPPPWSGGDDVPDKYRKLPAHCIPEWDRAFKLTFDATMAVNNAETAMAGMKGGAFEQALVAEGQAKLKDAAKLVKAAQPWAVCPKCRARQQMQEACNCCKGAGFVLRGVWEALPKGARA